LANVLQISTGIDAVDTAWGGFYQGGTYLCFGDVASGRGLIGMLFLQAGVADGERGVLVSPGRPQEWFIQADSAHFDLQGAYESGLARLLWIPDVAGLQHLDDAAAARALEDLVTLIAEERPARVVVNDFMPFLQFRSYEGFRQSFIRAVEHLGEAGSTVLLMLPDPINPVSRTIIDFMRQQVSGSLHVALVEEANGENSRQLTLLPGKGHARFHRAEHWELPIEASAETRRARRVKTSAAPQKARVLDPVLPASGGHAPASGAFATHPVEDAARSAFFDAIHHCFVRRGVPGMSFMLLALRMDAGSIPAPITFSELAAHVEQVLREADRVMVDAPSRRIVVLMPDARQDEVQRFFDALQGSLGQDHPTDRKRLLESVSVIVVPDGQPFERAEDFLAYAMEAR
jgi:KaiC/GvpD/RAD55 family RecA-like ATPase